ncbi:MAG: flagellar hook-length control protein FliK [Actinomycetota bacterium]|nr:flagellar hook-length control protein FliK [Actinomycetota bacterium]
MISVAPSQAQTPTASTNSDVPGDPTSTKGGSGSFLLEILSAVSAPAGSKPTQVGQTNGKGNQATLLDALVKPSSNSLVSGDSKAKAASTNKECTANPTSTATSQNLDLVQSMIATEGPLVAAGVQVSSKAEATTSNQVSPNKVDSGSTSSKQPAPANSQAAAPSNLLAAIAQFQTVQSSLPGKAQPSSSTKGTTSSVGSAQPSSSTKGTTPQVAIVSTNSGQQTVLTTQEVAPNSKSQAISSSISQANINTANQVSSPSANTHTVASTQTDTQVISSGKPVKNDASNNVANQIQGPVSNSFEGAINQALNSIPASVNRPVTLEIGVSQSYAPPTDLATPLSHVALSMVPHGGGSATVELSMSPANLGPITATLSIDKASMTVVLGASNQQTADLLSKHSTLIASELSKSSGLATTIDMSNGGSRGREDGGQRQGQPAPVSYRPQSPIETVVPTPKIIITSAHVVDVSL